MLSEPSREMWDHDGLCACGKRTYLFSRCPSCIEQEALDTAVEIAEREDAEVRGSPDRDRDPESPEVGVEVNGSAQGACWKFPLRPSSHGRRASCNRPGTRLSRLCSEASGAGFGRVGRISPSAEALLLASLSILRLGWCGRAWLS